MIWPTRQEIDIQANMEKLQADIRENADNPDLGWTAMAVHGDSGHPPFCYTIGLMKNWNHPELIIYGLNADLAHQLIACAIELIKGGARLWPDHRYEGIMENYEMEVREHPPGPPLNWTTDYYGEPVDAVQLVWPDAEGIFPGEEGFDLTYEGHQDPQLEA